MTEKQLHTVLSQHLPIKTKSNFRSVTYLISYTNKRFPLADNILKLEEWVLENIKDDRFRIRIRIFFDNLAAGHDSQYLEYSRGPSLVKNAHKKKKRKKEAQTFQQEVYSWNPLFRVRENLGQREGT